MDKKQYKKHLAELAIESVNRDILVAKLKAEVIAIRNRVRWNSVYDGTPDIVFFGKYSEDVLVWCDPFIHTSIFQKGEGYRRKEDGVELQPSHWRYFDPPPKPVQKKMDSPGMY